MRRMREQKTQRRRFSGRGINAGHINACLLTVENKENKSRRS